MKPPTFRYHRATEREEVDLLLDRLGEDVRILAGGQSLVPMMNMRLATPEHVVDVNALRGEPEVPVADDGALVIGPLIRVAALERSTEVRTRQPLLARAARLVGHAAVRNRGTVAGSIAHADPAAELPAVLAVLGGSVRARRLGATRRIDAADLLVGPLETSLLTEEWIDEVRVPILPAGAGVAIAEFSRRHGDFALCGACALAEPVPTDRLAVSVAWFGTTDPPARVPLPAVAREELTAAWLEEAVRSAVADAFRPHADIHATEEYRAHLAVRLGVRAAREAAGDVMASAQERSGGIRKR